MKWRRSLQIRPQSHLGRTSPVRRRPSTRWWCDDVMMWCGDAIHHWFYFKQQSTFLRITLCEDRGTLSRNTTFTQKITHFEISLLAPNLDCFLCCHIKTQTTHLQWFLFEGGKLFFIFGDGKWNGKWALIRNRRCILFTVKNGMLHYYGNYWTHN